MNEVFILHPLCVLALSKLPVVNLETLSCSWSFWGGYNIRRSGCLGLQTQRLLPCSTHQLQRLWSSLKWSQRTQELQHRTLAGTHCALTLPPACSCQCRCRCRRPLKTALTFFFLVVSLLWTGFLLLTNSQKSDCNSVLHDKRIRVCLSPLVYFCLAKTSPVSLGKKPYFHIHKYSLHCSDRRCGSIQPRAGMVLGSFFSFSLQSR